MSNEINNSTLLNYLSEGYVLEKTDDNDYRLIKRAPLKNSISMNQVMELMDRGWTEEFTNGGGFHISGPGRCQLGMDW